MRQDRFTTRPGIPAHQALDIHGRSRDEQFKRLEPVHVMDPVLHTKLLLRHGLILAPRPFTDHRLLCRCKRARVLREAPYCGRVTVGRNQRCQRLN